MPTLQSFRCILGAAVFGSLALASPVLAESMLVGLVRYPSGRMAANVTVVAQNEATQAIWYARSSSIGTYIFPLLPHGRYTISVSLPPLSFVATGIDVPPGLRVGFDILLCVCRDERLTIEGGATSLSTLADGSVGAHFSPAALESLPLVQGRTLQSILSLVPGLVFTDSTGTLAQFTAAGQRRLSNRLTIDGISADLAVDTAGPGIGEAGSGALPAIATTGGTQTLVPLAAVEEIQVRTSVAAPEHARAEGAGTVVHTRAGADRLSGSAFVDGRPDALAARDWFANAGRAPQRRTRMLDAGISIGGPLWPRRVQTFIAAERQQIDRPLFTSITVPSDSVRETSAASMRSVLDAYPLPNIDAAGDVAERAGWFPAISRYATVSARIDATVTARYHAFMRVNRGRSSGDELAPEPVPLRPRLTFTHREQTTTNTATAGLSSQWSTVLHELRVGVSSHRGTLDASPAADSQALPLDIFAPGADDAWVALSLYPGSVLMSGRTASAAQEQVQFGQTITIARGRHQWRLGGDYLRARSSSDAAAQRFAYTFLGIADLQQARVRSVLVTDAAPAAAQREAFAVFAQDQIRIAPRLSVNVGARYVVQPAPTSRNNLGPTLASFEALPNFAPREDNGPLWRTVRRLSPHVSGALQLVTADAWQTMLTGGWSLRAGELTSPGMTPFGRGAPYITARRIGLTAFPVPPGTLAAGGVAQPSEYFAFPEGLRAPSVQQWHVGLEQALGDAQRVSVGYAGAAGRDLIYAHGLTIPAPRAFVRGFSNDGESRYHALLAQYVRRLSRRWQADVAYTWSHAIDNDSGESLVALPPPALVAPTQTRGSADYDRRHVLRARVGWMLPWNVSLDVIASLQSGAPINVTIAKDIGGTVYYVSPDVIPGAPLWIPDGLSATGEQLNPDAFLMPTTTARGRFGRNRLRAAPLRQLDLALSRPLRLGRWTTEARVDVFNLTNAVSVAAPESRLTFANFGRPEQSQADALGTGTLTRGGLASIHQLGGPRVVQLGLRFGW